MFENETFTLSEILFGNKNNISQNNEKDSIHDFRKNDMRESSAVNFNLNNSIFKKNKPSLFYKSISAKVKISPEKKSQLRNVKLNLIKNYTYYA